jgi:excisionase family DNA binding protein
MSLGRTLVDELDDEALDALAERLAPRLASKLTPATTTADGWLDTKQAAIYVGLSSHALHKLTAAREIPFEQDGPGCKCWFRRSELDAWRRGEWQSHRLHRVA